jgi:tetratricopeptide (TPR) repeat protein
VVLALPLAICGTVSLVTHVAGSATARCAMKIAFLGGLTGDGKVEDRGVQIAVDDYNDGHAACVRLVEYDTDDSDATSQAAAIAADPSVAQNHYQLVHALSMLGQAHDAIARYRGRDDLMGLRCLAQAYVADGRWPEAAATIARAPGDAFMLEQEAGMLSRTGREEEALATWQRALAADPESIGGHYMRAFLLERLGRRAEAIAEWEAIIEWSHARGADEDAEWPAQEIARLRALVG